MNIIKVYKQFPTENDCLNYLERIRWNCTPQCPYCKSQNSTPIPKEYRHHCNSCNTTYSVTVGTIFHHTHLPLQKWFLAVSLILNAKKGISARQLARDLEVNKNTAWRISMKIRDAMLNRDSRELLTGVVEVDETFLGGKPRRGDKNNKKPLKRGRGTKKTSVVGLAERGGNVKAEIFKKDKLKAKNLSSLVRKNVDIYNTVLMTDEYKGYLGIKHFMPHKVINHQHWYVNGDIHTNSIESFWALLKRGMIGQFHKVSLKYLPRYIDEFCYRFNNRNNKNIFNQTILKGVTL